MSCNELNVNYETADKFFCQCETLDSKLKGDLFTTLIPSPLSSNNRHKKVDSVKVFVTEVNVDFANYEVSPTIQDPSWVNYDVDAVQVRLNDLFITSSDLKHIRFR